MPEPIYVTEVAERKPVYEGGVQTSLALWQDPDAEEWYSQFGDKEVFTFRKHSCEGMWAFYGLMEAIRERNEEMVLESLPTIHKDLIKNLNDLTSLFVPLYINIAKNVY